MDHDDESTPLVVKNVGKQTVSLRHWMIFPVMVLYSLPVAIMMYVTPEYVHERLDEEYSHHNNQSLRQNWTYDVCTYNDSDNSGGPQFMRYKHVQQETANWQNYFALTNNLPAVIANIVWASYSDIVGRRILMIICTAALFIRVLSLTIVVYVEANMAFIFIGELLDGLVGSFGTFLSVIFASIADITEKGRNRTLAITIMEILLGITFTVATFCIGYFIEYLGFFYPILTGLCSVFIALIIAIVIVPETLPERKTGGYRKLISSIATTVKLYFKPDSRLVQVKYVLLILAFIFFTMQSLTRGSIEVLYQLGKPFCWSYTKIGWFGAAKSGIGSLIGIGGIYVFKMILADDTIAVISCALTVVSYIVEGLARSVTVLYIVPVLNSLSILPLPIIRSLMSHLTPTEKQGAVFATLGSLGTLCSLLGLLTGNWVYSATIAIMNGFVFYILGLITAMSCIMLGIFMYVGRRYSVDSKERRRKKSGVN